MYRDLLIWLASVTRSLSEARDQTGVVMSAFTAGICRPKRIGIVGYYGATNLGDDTVVAILIHKIRERYPDAEIVGFSLYPVDTARRHGIKSFHISRQSEERSLRGPAPAPRIDAKPGALSRLKQLLK